MKKYCFRYLKKKKNKNKNKQKKKKKKYLKIKKNIPPILKELNQKIKKIIFFFFQILKYIYFLFQNY